ncbi:DNA-binding transcriptional LysR family regulator [Pseudomonas sp. TE3911]|jgi:DNA-binding transcriptional LysR family regulator
MMELRQLRHFIVVAEELHFGRAATRLGMAQPPLSQSIQRLEESLDARLLDRTSRQVSLTPAGKVLQREAMTIIAQVDFAEQAVRRQARGELSRMRIAFSPMSAMRILPAAVKVFNERWPNIEVHLDEQLSTQQIEGLRNGSLDIGILNRNMVNTDGLDVRVIEYSRVIAAVPARWKLADENGTLRLAELAGHSFVLSPQHLTPHFHTALESACRKAGFSPKRIQQVAQPYSMFNLVANELGIGFVQDTARHLPIEGVRFVTVRDLPDSMHGEAAVAWVPRALTPALRAMISLIERIAERERAAPDEVPVDHSV